MKPIVTVTTTPIYTLTIDKETAQLLRDIGFHVGGSPKTTSRGCYDALNMALEGAGITGSMHRIEGSVVCPVN